MIKNNLKTLVYFGLWYFVLVASVIFMNFRNFIGAIIPDALGPVPFFGIATLVYSIIFTLLFLRPMGSAVDNFSSLASLVALDIGVILAVALGALFMRFSYIELLMAIGFCIGQIVIMLLVLGLKKD
ncbi:MAG: hypothetical protein GX079_02805 [Tissierellia bacterium]|nr:hypothetical protein [Tissierellia bacterium]